MSVLCTPTGSYPIDFIAAVVAQIRLSAELLTILEDTPETPKIFTDHAGRDAQGNLPNEPYLVITEMSENPSFSTGKAYISEGRLSITVLDNNKVRSRQLRNILTGVLNDADTNLINRESRCMAIRHLDFAAPPLMDAGAENPDLYRQVVVFAFMLQRSL